MIVATAASSAAAIAYTPIPFSDWTLIVPIQISMIAGITATFGLSLSVATITSIMGSVITGTGATVVGRAIVSSLLKLIPGVGTAVGGTISATTAAAMTTAFGEAYIATLALLFTRNNGKSPSETEVIETFKRQYAQLSAQ